MPEESLTTATAQRRGNGLAIVILTAGALVACSNPVPVEKPRAAISAYASQLQQALQTALQENGPVGAVSVCHTRAAEIAAAAGAEYDVTIRRTSTRLRNPRNAPDAWEKMNLASFEQQLRNGAAPETLSATTATRTDARVTFRYMQPIIVQPLCLTCHGETLAPELAAAIDARYPQDQARGYRAGELRGAFSVTWQK